jgi:hypothetical protein
MPEQQDSCPLCEFTGKKPSDLYEHLMASHNKTEIAASFADPIPCGT